MNKYSTQIIGILLLTICCCLLTGCGEPEPQGELLVHNADVTGEMLVFSKFPKSMMLQGNPIGNFFNPPEVEFTTAVVSLESGETFAEYTSLMSLFLSPDSTRVLKLDMSASGNMKNPIFTLHNTNDDSEIWRAKLKLGFPVIPMMSTNWDDERGWLIVGILDYGISTVGALKSYFSPESMLEKTMWFHVITLDLNDGSKIAHQKLGLTFTEIMTVTTKLHYGGGRVFLAAKDDPFAQERDTESELLNIYAIDPVNGETEEFDLSDFNLLHQIDFLVNEDGDKIFFQNNHDFDTYQELKDEIAAVKDKLSRLSVYPRTIDDPVQTIDGKLEVSMRGVLAIDTETKKITPLLGHLHSGSSFILKGMTPDGSRICLVNGEYSDNARAFVYGVESDELIEIKRALDVSYADFWISPSGRFVVESYYNTDLWVHDIETGESRVLVSTEDNDWQILMPYIPGAHNISRF